MKYRHYILPLALTALVSCSSDNDMQQPTPDGKIQLHLTASLEGMTTRAANNLQTTSLASGNNVGVMVHEATPEGMQIASNTCYTVGTNGELTLSATSAPIFLQSDNDVNIHSYAPFRADMLDGYLNTSTKTDQSTSDNYIASDFLFGSPKAGNPVHPLPDTPVELSYRHLGSRIVVMLVPGDGIDASYLEGAQITTCPLSTDVSFYPKTQQMTVSSSTSSNITIGKVTSPTNLTHAAVILPQTVSALSDFLTVSFPDDANKLSFIYTPTAALTFESGKQYLYTMTVGKDGVTTTTEVKPWDEETAYTGEWELDDKSTPKQDIDLTQMQPNENNEIVLTYNAELTGTTGSRIIVDEGVDITLNNATIRNSVECMGNTTIYLKGNNVITQAASPTKNEERTGLCGKGENSTLVIDGDENASLTVSGFELCNMRVLPSNTLEIRGGNITATGSEYVSGIGCALYYSCGNIIISGGKITATGGKTSAGIGSSYYSSTCGDIIIRGGEVIAYGGLDAAGIGAGNYASRCGNITIHNAKVSAYGGTDAAGIGTGNYNSSCGNINIENSEIYSEGLRSIGLARAGYISSCGSIYVKNSTCTLKKTDTNYFYPSPTFSGTVVVYDSSDTTNDISGSISHSTSD